MSQVPANPEMCHCGRPLHYSDPKIRQIVEGIIFVKGADVEVKLQGRTWLVPRHYIALHGLKGTELPTLGFREVTDRTP